MALIQSDHARGRLQTPVPAEYGVAVTARFAINLTAAPSAGDIIEIGGLPAHATIVDAILDADALDTGTPALALSVGIMSGAYQAVDDTRTCGTELFDGSTTAQAGGISRMTKQTGFRIEKVAEDRGIGVEVDAAAGTFAPGTLRLLVTYVQA